MYIIMFQYLYVLYCNTAIMRKHGNIFVIPLKGYKSENNENFRLIYNLMIKKVRSVLMLYRNNY